MSEVCRHCRRRCRNRPRGLCQRCYDDGAVRRLYPGRPAPYGENGSGELPAAAVADVPGSPGKLAAIAERVRLGLSPWHPGDPVQGPEPRAPTVAVVHRLVFWGSRAGGGWRRSGHAGD